MPHVFVSRDVYEKLKRVAEESGLSYSEVIRRALEGIEGSSNGTIKLVKSIEEIAVILREILEVLREIKGMSITTQIQRDLCGTVVVLGIKGMSITTPTAVGVVVNRVQDEETLPSFAKDNPWLEVLKSRGKD